MMIGVPRPDDPPPTFRDMWNESLRYWEPRRLVYNGLLLCVCLFYLAATRNWHRLDQLHVPFMLVVAAGGANLCYTVAHPVDLALQWSDFRESWRHSRWMLFGLGSIFAVALTALTLPEILRPF